jgi:hypothetical protein
MCAAGIGFIGRLLQVRIGLCDTGNPLHIEQTRAIGN